MSPSSSTSSSSVVSSSSSLSYLRPPVAALKRILDDFVQNECLPAEAEWEAHLQSILSNSGNNERFAATAVPPCLERLQTRAKALGLWNLFIPQRLMHKIPLAASQPPQQYGHVQPSLALTYREYGIFCEALGRCPHLAPEACNCSAPDTGNMEVLLEFGTVQQQEQYLIPLLRGEMRSTFLMTEPHVASSDATNLETRLLVVQTRKSSSSSDGGGDEAEYILQGEKWWSSGAMDPRCRLALVVAKMDYSQVRDKNSKNNNDTTNKHGAHTIVAVPLPHPQVEMKRALTVFGYDDAPVGHAHVVLHQVKVHESDLIAGEGSGFRVAQARLGPGRIHHCMRAIGMAARSFELMLQRSTERKTFGQYLHEHGMTQAMIADSFADLQAARLLTLHCAAVMDDNHNKNHSNSGSSSSKEIRVQIAMIKATVPEMALRIVDRAIQVFGGAGVCQDFCLARFWAMLRTLRIADGPDAVHKRTVARLLIQKIQQQQQQQQVPQGCKSRL